jgi:mannosyltransferase
MLRSRSSLVAAGLFVFALLLRLHALSKTLDLDEMATAAWAMSKGLGDLFTQLRYPIEGNAAGYPVLAWFWAKLGLAEWWLRLPSALAGAGVVAVFYRRNARRIAPEAALWAALLLAVAYFPLLESQNARCYALYALFAYLALDQWERERHSAFVACSWIALSLHHFAFLYLAPLWAVSAARVARRERGWSELAPAAVTLLCYLPELPLLLHQLRGGPTWIPPLTPAGIAAAFTSLAWLHGAVATGILAAAMLAGLSRLSRLRFELAWAFFPIVAGAAISWLYRSVFLDQYFFPSCLGLFGLAASGLDLPISKGVSWPARLGALVSLALALAALPAFYATPKTADWRGAAEFVLTHECGKLLVTDPYWVNRWPYYVHDRLAIHHWNEGFPKEPFWLAGAGHPPLPRSLHAIGEKLASQRWQGQDALVYCIRPEP